MRLAHEADRVNEHRGEKVAEGCAGVDGVEQGGVNGGDGIVHVGEAPGELYRREGHERAAEQGDEALDSADERSGLVAAEDAVQRHAGHADDNGELVIDAEKVAHDRADDDPLHRGGGNAAENDDGDDRIAQALILKDVADDVRDGHELAPRGDALHGAADYFRAEYEAKPAAAEDGGGKIDGITLIICLSGRADKADTAYGRGDDGGRHDPRGERTAKIVSALRKRAFCRAPRGHVADDDHEYQINNNDSYCHGESPYFIFLDCMLCSARFHAAARQKVLYQSSTPNSSSTFLPS